jgi:ketosteroid isomerase-like protein
MSEENVAIVGRFVESWVREDREAMADLVHPDVEMHATVGGVEEGRVTRGIDEITREYDAVEEMWDEHRIEIERVLDAGDQVVVFQHEYQRGKGSGIELEIDTAAIFDVRDGRIARMQGYMDRAEALKAAGLPADAGQSPGG